MSKFLVKVVNCSYILEHYENHEKLISYFKLDHTFHLNKYGKWPGDEAIISQG